MIQATNIKAIPLDSLPTSAIQGIHQYIIQNRSSGFFEVDARWYVRYEVYAEWYDTLSHPTEAEQNQIK